MLIANGLCFGDNLPDDRLIQFWKAHPNAFGEDMSKYLAVLRQAGIQNPNELIHYLKIGDCRIQAFNSMWLLATNANSLNQDTIKIIGGIIAEKNPPPSLQEQVTGIKLLLGCMDNNDAQSLVQNVIWGLSTEGCDQVLSFLGEAAKRDNTKIVFYRHMAQQVIQLKVGYASGTVIPRGTNSVEKFISIIREWPLFDNSELSNASARLLLAHLKGPVYFPREELKLLVRFLLLESKADQKLLAEQLSIVACGKSRYSKQVLWLLVKTKSESKLAQISLDQFRSDCDGDKKQLYEDIMSGKVGEREIFEFFKNK